jgi:hypothetical protein
LVFSFVFRFEMTWGGKTGHERRKAPKGNGQHGPAQPEWCGQPVALGRARSRTDCHRNETAKGETGADLECAEENAGRLNLLTAFPMKCRASVEAVAGDHKARRAQPFDRASGQLGSAACLRLLHSRRGM